MLKETDYIFPLRKDLSIVFSGMPRDLSTQEVERMVRFLEALVMPEKPKETE